MIQQEPEKAGHYRVIYADPPWSFVTYSDKGKGRSAEAHYDCMSLSDIKALPVSSWAALDAVLLMWVTDPLLPRALEVIESWGFTYKTVGFYWAKLNKNVSLSRFSFSDFFTGMGYWTRANPEMCLLATKGRPQRLAKNVRRLIVSPRREHSRKPDEAFGRIERLLPGPYLEMFSRTSRQGWDSWGAEQSLFDKGGVDTRRRPSSGKVVDDGQNTFLLDLEREDGARG